MNNEHLKDFLDSTPSSDLRRLLNMRKSTRSMVSYIADDSSAQTQGVLSEMQQAVREMFIGNFKRKERFLSVSLYVQKVGAAFY